MIFHLENLYQKKIYGYEKKANYEEFVDETIVSDDMEGKEL